MLSVDDAGCHGRMTGVDPPSDIQHNRHIHCPANMAPNLNIEDPAGSPAEQRRTARLIDALVAAVGSVPTAGAELTGYEVPDGALTHDAALDVRVGNTRFSLLVEVKSELYPRDAREQIARWAGRAGHPRRRPTRPEHFLIAADLISDGARHLLAAENIGFFADGGSLCFPFPGAFIYIDRPAPARAARPIGSLFTGARAHVLHALLVQPQTWHSVQDLAERSGASPGTVSNLLKQMEQLEWVRTEGQGPFKTRQLVDPGTLLTAWASNAAEKATAVRRYFVPGAKAAELPQRIAAALSKFPRSYELTAEAAAQHYAAFLTTFPAATVRALPEAVDRLALSLGAKEVAQGANLHVIDAVSPKDFRLNADGEISYATPVRTYLDLVNAPGRGKEAAEHLREQVLKF